MKSPDCTRNIIAQNTRNDSRYYLGNHCLNTREEVYTNKNLILKIKLAPVGFSLRGEEV